MLSNECDTFVDFDACELCEKGIDIAIHEIEHIGGGVLEEDLNAATSLVKSALLDALNLGELPSHRKDLFAPPAADCHVIEGRHMGRSKSTLPTLYISSP